MAKSVKLTQAEIEFALRLAEILDETALEMANGVYRETLANETIPEGQRLEMAARRQREDMDETVHMIENVHRVVKVGRIEASS